MRIYLARHGDYSLNKNKQDVLNEKGINEINQLKNFLMPLHIRVTTLLHSEKIRARQTAELLSPSLLCDQPFKVHSGLNPNDDVSVFANEIVGSNEDLVVVGHLPFLSKLVGQLVVNDAYKEIVFFHTGTLVCLGSLDTTRFIIQWVWNPSLGSAP